VDRNFLIYEGLKAYRGRASWKQLQLKTKLPGARLARGLRELCSYSTAKRVWIDSQRFYLYELTGIELPRVYRTARTTKGYQEYDSM